MAGNRQAAKLREALARGEFILAPGVYDGISARVADRMGFPALYMTGYGATASMLGLPDAGLATYSDMLGIPYTTPFFGRAGAGYSWNNNLEGGTPSTAFQASWRSLVSSLRPISSAGAYLTMREMSSLNAKSGGKSSPRLRCMAIRSSSREEKSSRSRPSPSSRR